MSLLLQLDADIPGRFPGYERKLYVFECRRKACRRKDGSVRALRALKAAKVTSSVANTKHNDGQKKEVKASAPDIGNSLFGVQNVPGALQKMPQSRSALIGNPFTPAVNGAGLATNPFATSKDEFKTGQASPATLVTDLPDTFANKLRVHDVPSTLNGLASEPWPQESSFPEPYPSYHVDADQEALEGLTKTGATSEINTTIDNSSGITGENDDLDGYESAIDKTFRKFADRLAENPDQILRYEFGGIPLLYSKRDAVGQMLDPHQVPPAQKVNALSRPNRTGIPNCKNCGSTRVFELQLTPQAITELEAEDEGIDGLEWGTIIVGVCAANCSTKASEGGKTAYLEEWIGVQWEQRNK